MKTPLWAERYYQITIASVGLVLLIYALLVFPPTGINPAIFLLLMILAGFLVQYSIKLLNNEFTLIPVVAIVGSLVLDPVLTAWAITFGMIFGVIFQWLVHKNQKWEHFINLDNWLKVGFKVGINLIPLLLIFSIIGNSPSLEEILNLVIWPDILLVSIIFLIVQAILYILNFAIVRRSSPCPNIRSDLISIITIDLLSILFVIIVTNIYSDYQIEALILFAGIPSLIAYLLNQVINGTINKNEAELIKKIVAQDAITETIVHDVRSPMSAIVGALELLSDSLSDNDNPIVEQALVVAQRSANRVFLLTEELLDIARLQSGRMEIALQDINFHTLIEELMIEFTALANDNNVIILNKVPDKIPPIRADQDKLIRIITNLVDNAIKFSPQGGHVIISAEKQNSQFMTVKVTDYGAGIPLDYREKIFDRFIQVPGQRSQRAGTGLGLAFCRLSVEAHGGEIWVDQNPEGGSVFTFTIPLAKSF